MFLADFDVSWWEKSRFNDRLIWLKARNVIKNAVREWFKRREFCEVETALLQISPGNETHLQGFKTSWHSPNGKKYDYYLPTSPEFALKKLLAAGMERVFEFARVFRNGESSLLHAPEFTMLEFYAAGRDYMDIIKDSWDLCLEAANAMAMTHFSHQQNRIAISVPPEYLKVADAFWQYAGIDLAKMMDKTGFGLRDDFAKAAQNSGLKINSDDTWGDIFTKILIEKIDPHLGIKAPTIFYEYPLPEAALARPCPENPKFAQRFELYICGVEIANGFGELTDAIAQRRRFEADMKEMQRIYGHDYPLDEDFLAALQHMPEASGVAIGFDRLIMLISGINNIQNIMWTPFESRE